MVDEIRNGLEAFAAGDLARALRIWSNVSPAHPDFKYAKEYLDYVRSIDPVLFSEILVDFEVSAASAMAQPTSRDAAERPEDPHPWDFGNSGARDIAAPFAVPALASDSDDGALGLVERASQARGQEATKEPEPESVAELERRLVEVSELDDLSGALAIARRILALDPEHQFARAAKERSRDVLMKMSVSKIGDLDAVPTVLCPPNQVIWLDLDHRSGFILSQVDGVSSYLEIMDIAGMDQLECITILAGLVEDGVIGEPSS